MDRRARAARVDARCGQRSVHYCETDGGVVQMCEAQASHPAVSIARWGWKVLWRLDGRMADQLIVFDSKSRYSKFAVQQSIGEKE